MNNEQGKEVKYITLPGKIVESIFINLKRIKHPAVTFTGDIGEMAKAVASQNSLLVDGIQELIEKNALPGFDDVMNEKEMDMVYSLAGLLYQDYINTAGDRIKNVFEDIPFSQFVSKAKIIVKNEGERTVLPISRVELVYIDSQWRVNSLPVPNTTEEMYSTKEKKS
jgi:hypothetical protein